MNTISKIKSLNSFYFERVRADASFITGWSSPIIGSIYYKIIGDIIFYNLLITGTSNSTSVIIKLPYGLNYQICPGIYSFKIRGQDNSGNFAQKYTIVSATNNQLILQSYNSDGSTFGWTASGTKRIEGQFIIPIAK